MSGPQAQSDADIRELVTECDANGYLLWRKNGEAHISPHGLDLFWTLVQLMPDRTARKAFNHWRVLLDHDDKEPDDAPAHLP